MCLALPAQIVKINNLENAVITIGGVEKEISLSLVDNVQVGDFVIVHVGYALARLDEKEARKTLALFSEIVDKKDLAYEQI